jgi:HEAT repeat protein
LALAVAFGAVVVSTACRSEHNLTPEHDEQVRQTLKAGLQLDGNDGRISFPRTRAETLRVLGHLDGQLYSEEMAAAVDAEDPTVRVAAVRALFEADHPKAGALARRALSKSEGRTTRSLLNAVFDYDDPNSGPAQEVSADYMWQALGPDYAPSVRRVAFHRGIEPLIQRTMSTDETKVRKTFLPKLDSALLGRLDTAVGGDALRLMADLGEADRAEPLIELVTDESATTQRRVKAARILRSARLEQAAPAFQTIIDRASFAPNLDRLSLPDSPVPNALLKAATLGLVAIGNDEHVSRAKDYMTRAGADRFVDVLKALSQNPSEGARIALKNALQDARPSVRHRAIKLWAHRDGAGAEPLLNLIQHASFEQQARQTRYEAAEVLARHYPEKWRTQMQRQLTSDEGISPALDLLVHLQSTPRLDIREALSAVREPLKKIASADPSGSDSGASNNAGRAARLLVPFSEQPEVAELIQRSSAPRARYAYLEHLISQDASKHVAYILDNFYGKHPGADVYAVRMMAAAALWRAME